MLTKTGDSAAFGVKTWHGDCHHFKTFCAQFFGLLCHYCSMKRNTDHLIGRGSLAQRFEQGRLARQHCPRSALGLQGSAERDALALLAASNDGRIAELLPTRFGRMLASPFAFYRGAATLMAHDLAQTPRCPVTVQLCGEAHLSNFCLFASPERRLLFGLNKPTPTTASVSSMASGFVRPAAMCFWAGPAARRWALIFMCASCAT